MKNDRVGIYAPYDWDEATYVAIRLAELVRQFGQVPSFHACSANLRGVGRALHADWDDEVIWTREGVKKWIEDQRTIIWLGLHGDLLNYARAKGVKNVFVPLLHRLEHHNLRRLRLFDIICCTNELTYLALYEAGLKNLVHTGWDSGLACQDRLGPCHLREENVLVIPEWPITNEWGVMLAYTIRHLLDAVSTVNVTILQPRQWPKLVNRAMLDLTMNHVSRVEMLRAPNYHCLLNAYDRHDWALYLPEKVNVGVRLVESFTRGMPVVSLDLPPIPEFVTQGVSARLIDCEHRMDVLGRPEARLNTHDTAEAIHRTIGDRNRWYDLSNESSRDKICSRRKEKFEMAWSSVWLPF